MLHIIYIIDIYKRPQPIVTQDNGCYESTPGEFKTTKLLENLWTIHTTFISVLYWIQTYCAYGVLAWWRMRACGDSGELYYSRIAYYSCEEY